ncbi:hypothetical protein BT69DRAFT_1284463 [Atractiella rhizophila]|nr:hypothetical protein BT69DRAFT_1284463 [Atractiella rhizophila]
MSIRNTVERHLVTADEAQHLCLELMQLCHNFRQFREGSFEAIIQSPDEVTNREQPIFRSVLGDEPFAHSVLFQSRETRSLFLLSNLINTCREIYPEHQAFEEMARAMQFTCDQHIHLVFDLFEILWQRNEKFPRPILDEGFMSKLYLLFTTAFDARYLVNWSRRYPDRKPTVKRMITVLKHLSFFVKETADQVTAFEEVEAGLQNKIQAIKNETPLSGTSYLESEQLSDLDSTGRSTASSSIVTARTSHSPFSMGSPPSRGNLRSPSPSIRDFSATLTNIIAKRP